MRDKALQTLLELHKSLGSEAANAHHPSKDTSRDMMQPHAILMPVIPEKQMEEFLLKQVS